MAGWATIVERGCGERVPGGLYAECGLSAGGSPLEHFLLDSPLVIPEGLDLINKAQVWEHPETGICHLVIWVGASHYPYVSDYIEEVRRFGASRRIGSGVDIARLTPGQSRMILAHPHCRAECWLDVQQPFECLKDIPGHALHDPRVGGPTGPCLFKAYELIPADAGEPLVEVEGRMLYQRTHASTTYTYTPTGEPDAAARLRPGLFATLPLHGFGLVKNADGSANERLAEKLDRSGMDWYLADK